MSYRSSTTLFLSISSIGLLIFSTFSETLLLSSLLWAVIQLFQSTIVELRSHNLTRTFQSRVILGHHSNFDSKWNHDQSAFFFTTNSSQVLNRSFVIFQEPTISRFQDLFFLNFISFSQCLTVIISPSCKLFNCFISHFTVHTSWSLWVSLRFWAPFQSQDFIPNSFPGFDIFFHVLSFQSIFNTFHSLSILTLNVFHHFFISMVTLFLSYCWNFILTLFVSLNQATIQNIVIRSSAVTDLNCWSNVKDNIWSVHIILPISHVIDKVVDKIFSAVLVGYFVFKIHFATFQLKFHIGFHINFNSHKNAMLCA